MYLNASRIRVGLMGAGLLTLCLYLLAGGRLGPGNRGLIVIEYGTWPEVFEGMQVAIDGQPAGVLKPYGAATRTIFSVVEGRHLVRVNSDRFVCRTRIVNVESGHTHMLVLDVGGAPRDSTGRTSIFLQ